MRKLLLFILLFISTLAYSIPAKRITQTVVVDGQEVKLTLRGTERAHFWLSEDGKKYFQKKDGSFALFPEENYQKALQRNRFTINREESMASDRVAMKKARAQRKIKYQGERRGLVILVNFSDNSFTSTTKPLEDYKNVLSTENYKGSKNFGSVRDYFKAQSYGKFDFVLDVAGPVTLSHNLKYYGENDDYYNEDIRPGTMVWEACKAVDEEVDFSKYDWDGDGTVEQVFVIYAGYGEAASGKTNTIWPHASTLTEMKNYESEIGSCVFDGVTVDSYACSCELLGSRGTTQDGIGTICHEFSHCFGLPDFYCTDDNHTEMCMESWSLMDYGSYSNSGYTPASYTAYERWYCGWAEPTELSSAQYVEGMKNIDNDGESYIICNDGNRNEYYILQNIQKTGWNSYAPAHGLLVLHVDYSDEAWEENTPNNTKSHLRMTPICADNKHTNTTLSGDTYPGTYKNTSLTDDSAPKASLYNKNTDGKLLMHKPITEIAESSDGLISFTFMGGMALPSDVECELKDGDIYASWSSAGDDYTYNIRYGIYDEGSKTMTAVVNEDFAKLKAASDGTLDISSSLDKYLNTKGCTGSKLYMGSMGMKMSSSTVSGELVLPALTNSTGTAKITLGSQKYSKDNCTITVNVYEKGVAEPYFMKSPCAVGEEVSIDLNLRDNSVIAIQPTKRCYLNKLIVEVMSGNSYSDPQTITGITSCQYNFTPSKVSPSGKYWIQLQTASSNGKTSDWSDIILVESAPTGIYPTLRKDKEVSDRYNLQGQRVGNDYRGIIIKNGKKYILK